MGYIRKVLILMFLASTAYAVDPIYDFFMWNPFTLNLDATLSTNTVVALSTTAIADLNEYLRKDGTTPLTADWEAGAFKISAGELLIDTNTLAVNLPSYEDKVGIGTVTPEQRLHVYSPAQDTILKVESDGDNAYIYLDSALQKLSGVILMEAGNPDWSIVNQGATDDSLVIINGAGALGLRFTGQGATVDVSIPSGDLRVNENIIATGTITGSEVYTSTINAITGLERIAITSSTILIDDKYLYFRSTDSYIYSNNSKELTLAGTTKTTIGTVGDIEIGDGTLRYMFPNTDLKISLGKSANKFYERHINNVYISTINPTAGIERIVITTDTYITGSLGIGTTALYSLDIVGSVNGLQMRFANNVTDATSKTGGFSMRHYTNAEEDVSALVGSMSNTANTLLWGGGSNFFNAATEHQFWTGTDNVDTRGTKRLSIESDGDFDFEGNLLYDITTIDTGQGANELYAMNQDVQTTDSVGFLEVTISTINATAGIERIVHSSDVYGVGYSSYTEYFGDGSNLTGITATGDNLGNHVATTTLNMANFDITGANEVAASSFTIGANSLDTNEWANLDGIDQGLATSDDVIFAKVTTDDLIHADYVSITATTSFSGSAAAERDIFDEDNWTNYGYDTNVTAKGITYTSSTGRFQVDEAGIYLITGTWIMTISANALADVIIQKEGIDIYQHSYYIHADVDPATKTVSIIAQLNTNDYINFRAVAPGAQSLTFYHGCTATIYKIAGL